MEMKLILWNLLLAFVPYGVSSLAVKVRDEDPLKWFLVGIWLLFLPNAGYMLTDVIHFDEPMYAVETLALILAIGFALYFMCRSICLIVKNLPFRENRTLTVVFVLNGYGIFLGRYLRLNSWDAFMYPDILLHEALESFNLFAIGFMVLFAIVTFVIYEFYMAFRTNVNFCSREEIL